MQQYFFPSLFLSPFPLNHHLSPLMIKSHIKLQITYHIKNVALRLESTVMIDDY